MKQMIYADNAATTKLDPDAFEAMIPFLTNEFGNPSQKYSFSRNPRKALEEARISIATCIGASPNEVFFTSGGSESDNWAIKSTAFHGGKEKAIITSSFEHHAVLHACAAVERLGYPVAYIPPAVDGMVSPERLSSLITDKTQLVSIMFANNEIGTIQQIKTLSAIAHSHGALFHTDAVQAVGHIPINVKQLDIDMLSASAHKFNGPRGIGFLYVRDGLTLPPLIDGGAQEAGRRAGTENVASIVAMAVALKNNCDKMHDSILAVSQLETYFLEHLDALGIRYCRNGSGKTLPGLISLSFRGKEGEAILHRLDLQGICVSTGSACNSQSTEVSHVLKAISLEDELAKGTIRIALGKDNTREEVDRIVLALRRILSE